MSQAMPPLLNKTMKFVLRSPMHRMVSKTLTLITFTGRKSGKTYTTPVSYYQKDDQVCIFTHANWWKNLRGGAPVTLRLRGKDVLGTAEPISEDKQAIANALAEHLQKNQFDARFYKVTIDDKGLPVKEDIDQAVKTVAMVQVKVGQ
jgi:deazaflavin-dependent oxidoreductase (nitroreductase family)